MTPSGDGGASFRLGEIEQAADLPPSARTIAVVLYHEGVLCHGELIEATGLAGRTVRTALSALADAGLLSSRPRLTDARKTDYQLRVTEVADVEAPVAAATT